MKLNNIFSVAVGLGLALGLSGCEGEKDLIIIEGNLPIKTSALYMVGDATPNGWSIDNPTPLTAEGEDPLIFSWEGELNS
ncbi:MAG: SusF/SusE family outer membrane protein, partial [Muribaculaceae bacterium]|nr:SusF/SusE family outer membrane protein [Muribaculaceae bacterium]